MIAFIGRILSVFALFFMFLAMIPFLGWLNWLNIPFAVVALLISIIGRFRGGMILCLVVILVGMFRLKMGWGII
ncbi:MAG: hypothetical protein LBQ60_08030 [Bacteroidales bacterium]|nr:hypothetical protein [Bacteroidales bacterium]